MLGLPSAESFFFCIERQDLRDYDDGGGGVHGGA